jgi:hypothetical protein
MKLEHYYRRIVKSSESKPHTISVIHYNPGTLTNLGLSVKSKDFLTPEAAATTIAAL